MADPAPPSSPESDHSREVLALFQHINKVYGQGDALVHALRDVSLAVHRGDYLAVMGASGSGKSTAMNILGCLDRPSSGRYWLNGIEVDQLTDDELAEIRNKQLGFVFQQFHLLPQFSAVENVMLPMIYAGVPADERRQRAINALQRVGLGHRLENRPNQLSGGQQQRVAIARAIINRPSLLLADEPTGNLDARHASDALTLIRETCSENGSALLLVSHDPGILAQFENVGDFAEMNRAVKLAATRPTEEAR